MNENPAADRDCVDAIERVGRLAPSSIAIVDGDTAWSYGDLLQTVATISTSLIAAGLRPGHRVALVAESSARYLATALGVWRAGGVLVTLYPSSGFEDIQYAIAGSDPVLVVIGDEFDPGLLGPLADVIPVARISATEIPHVRGDASPNPEGLRERLNLICYSSGTTSRPKAIMLSATTVLNCARTYQEVWHLGPEDRGIVCLPMAWMYGLASTSLAILLGGGTVIVVRRARPELIANAVLQHDATFLAGVANTFTKLVHRLDEEPARAQAFASLRLCISGGEPRNESAFERWRHLTGTAVLDAYCSSECLPLVTYDPTVDSAPRPGSAGRVVPRAKLRVVDPEGRDVPPGEVGEALSGGPGLMLGYWQDEEQTAAAVTKDGWYRTRDLVRVDDEGYVYVVGRLSDVIIRAGVNISPAEVERVIGQHPAVAEVVVVGLPDADYGEEVVAVVVPRRGAEAQTPELTAYAKSHLTNYKVPGRFIFLDELPVNATGKVSRKDVAARLMNESASNA